MTDEDHRAVELVDNRRGEGGVVGDPAQRVRRRENGVTVADEPVEHRPPAGRVSERAVHWVTALVALNGHSAHGAVVVLDEATLVSVTSATPTGPRSLAAS
jgi:hypothetical protein